MEHVKHRERYTQMGDLTQGAGTAASVSGSPRWNHNSAFYPELVADTARRGGAALDVGCGDGVLLELLAEVCERVVGVESDPSAAQAAARRVLGKGRVICGDFMDARVFEAESFDTVTCVACLHHMPLEAALSRMAELLRPGGRLLVIGLYANSSAADWLLSALMVAPAKALGWFRSESTYPAMVTAPAKDSLDDIRAAAATLLPDALVRRRTLWRYSLEWTKGAAARP